MLLENFILEKENLEDPRYGTIDIYSKPDSEELFALKKKTFPNQKQLDLALKNLQIR